MKLSRRDALKYSLMLSSATLFESILVGGIKDSLANIAGITPAKYVGLFAAGAPPWWSSFLPLAHESEMSFNQMVATKFKENSAGTDYVDVEYKTWRHAGSGIDLPWLWQFNVPNGSGGTTALSDLLSNAAFLRGLDTASDDHGLSSRRHYQPIGVPFSLPTVSADFGNNYIPGFKMGNLPPNSFVSNLGLSPINLPFSNPLHVLQKMFVSNSSSSTKSQMSNLNSLVDQLYSEMNNNLEGDRKLGKKILNNKSLMKDILNRGFNDINTYWPQAYGRYSEILTKIFTNQMTFPGLNDKPIGRGLNKNDGKWGFTNGGSFTGNDLNTYFTDLSNPAPLNLARIFAVSEYVVSSNISSVLVNGIDFDMNYRLTANWSFDEHGAGTYVSLYRNAFLGLGLGACLLEFKDKIGTEFNNTLIDISGDFGRTPKVDGSGSDHSGSSKSVALFGGMIDGAHLIGNIAKNNNSLSYPGTFGNGAENPGLGMLNIGNYGATLVNLLGVPKAYSDRPSLLIKGANGKFTSALPKGKII